MHKIRVDYHFHPNFHLSTPLIGKFLTNSKARRIWKAFEKHNLDIVLISEHAFKQPKTSFEILEKHKPANAKTQIFPAIEAVTKLGTDILVFAKESSRIYSKKQLLTPYFFTVQQLTDFINADPGLYGIVVHPYTLGTTGIMRNNGKKQAIKTICALNMVEEHNAATIASIKILKALKLNNILKTKYSRIKKTRDLPSEISKQARIKTSGSDAHHLGAIGSYAEIEIPDSTTPDSYFNIITTKSGKFIPKKTLSFYTFIRTMLTNLCEGIMRRLKLYKIDKPIKPLTPVTPPTKH
jgi:hypothetical protein